MTEAKIKYKKDIKRYGKDLVRGVTLNNNEEQLLNEIIAHYKQEHMIDLTRSGALRFCIRFTHKGVIK